MSRIEGIFKFIGILICLMFIILPLEIPAIEYFLFFIILIFLGIPHGAIDHLISEPKISRKGLLTFLAYYILLIIIYLIVWIFIPVIALSAFILMSAYHFGQTHFIRRAGKNSGKTLLYISRGLFFLLLILGGNFALTKEILQPILSIEGWDKYLPQAFSASFALTLILQWNAEIRFTPTDLFELAILGPLLYFSPLMIGFIIYFGFWHALPSMISEYAFLKKFPEYNTLKKFGKQLLPFTLISLLGISLILVFGMSFLAQNELILLFFVLISLISFPHILYMDQFWKRKVNTDRS